MKPQPQFLRVRWEDITEHGATVTLEAMACLKHRQEIALAHPSARGVRELGEACDLCEGRHPRSLGSDRSPLRSIQLGSPDGSPARRLLSAPRAGH
jgi:hypothetical protein